MIDRPFGHENTGLDTCKQTAVKDLAIIIYDREDLASTIRTFRGRRSLSTIFNLSPNDDGELNDPMEINRNEITFSFDTRCQHVFQPCATRRCVARRITAKFFIYGRKLARKRGVLKKKKRKEKGKIVTTCPCSARVFPRDRKLIYPHARIYLRAAGKYARLSLSVRRLSFVVSAIYESSLPLSSPFVLKQS